MIDNIPFIAKRVSLGDTVAVEYDETEGAFYFDDFVAVSGNTTLRLYFENASLIEPTRKKLGDLGCESEVFLQRKIVAVNVPKEVDYIPIKKYLDDGEKMNNWEYEESCLAHQY